MPSYQPEQWRDFFVMVGNGAAALTGLAVVAMSMHVEAIKTRSGRAPSSTDDLGQLGGVFMQCSLALLGGQDGRAVAVEIFVVGLGVAAINFFSYLPVARTPTPHPSSLLRTMGGYACTAVELLGAALLFFGVGWGLNLAATAMIASFSIVIAGSWMLLLGIRSPS